MTKTCEMADVVLPASASWCEVDGGTVTNSERRVQRMRKALDPPGQARDDHWIICELARRLGHDWGQPTLEQAWDEMRSLSPMHGGMSYRAARGARRDPVAVSERGSPGSLFLHGRLWEEPVGEPRGAVLGHEVGAADRRAQRRVPDPADDRPAAGLLQHRCAVEPVQLAAAPRRDARSVPGGRRGARRGARARSCGSALAAGRSTRRCGSTRAFGPGWRS